MNNIKNTFLLVTLTLVLVWAGGALGGKQGMTIALIFALGMNFIHTGSVTRSSSGCTGKTGHEAEAPDLHSIVRSLVQKPECRLPKVYIMDQEQPNAFATGRNPQHAAVAVTTGITRILTR